MFEKKPFIKILVFVLLASFFLTACTAPDETPVEEPAAAEEEMAEEEMEEPDESEEPVVLTFGNWRTEDVDQMERILAKFHENHPNIIIKYDPTDAVEYDAATRTQLETGTGTDLYYLRSVGISFDLYNEGHFVPIDDLPGLENMSPESIEKWTADDGHVFGVGYISTSHGVYYNMDIFDELGLEIPQTWDELMEVAQAVQDAGYTPFANASGDSWTIGTLLIQSWVPNIVGGVDGRLAYQNGKKCLNDENWVQVYQNMADMAPFLPEGQEALVYVDSQSIFLLGEAAMFIDGSWDIPAFELDDTDFEWGIFPVPVQNEGDPLYVEWELDAGVGINAASEHIEEAKIFLSWLTTNESAKLLASELPGFFPMTKTSISIDNAHAQAFLDMRDNAEGTDIRFYMPDGQPTAYSLLTDNSIKILNGEMTPEEAAQSLYDGVSSWDDGQASCGQ